MSTVRFDRRAMLSAVPVLALGSAAYRVPEPPRPVERQDSRGGATPRAVTQVKLMVIGLWLHKFINGAAAHVLAAMNSEKTKIPGTQESLCKHHAYLIIPRGALASDVSVNPVTPAERKRWRFITEDGYVKVPLEKRFEVTPLVDTLSELIYAAIPLGSINPGASTIGMWYTKTEIATAYSLFQKGVLRHAEAHKPVRALWTFDSESNLPGTDTPRRLSDMLEFSGSGENTVVKINGKTVTKTGLGSLTGFLINLPDHVTSTEEENPHVLHHARAYYKVFTTPPRLEDMRIPRTKQLDLFAGGEPIFCPPATL